MVAIESNGPIPADYSMIFLGTVVVQPGMDQSGGGGGSRTR